MDKLIRIATVPISLEKLLENQLTYMSKWYDVTAISAEKERIEKFGKNNNVKTFHIALTRQITPLQDLKALYKLYKYLKKTKPEIVHTHTPKAGIVGMLAANLAKVPNRLHTVAGLPLLEAAGFRRKVLNFVEKLTYYCATKVYPNSYGLYEFILKNKFIPESKLKVIENGSSNGIDTDYFQPDSISISQRKELQKKLVISYTDMVFVFVGRIVKDKGINELIAAFKKLNQVNKNTKLLLVGPTEAELDTIHSETQKEIDNNPAIISVGYQNDVRPYFAISQILAFPSYREGFPNVVMQAGAMGIPSIVTNINGCNEIIIEGENGMIIPPKDEDALYNAMEYVINNKEKVANMSTKARPLIESRFEQKVVWEAILKEYNKLTDKYTQSI